MRQIPSAKEFQARRKLNRALRPDGAHKIIMFGCDEQDWDALACKAEFARRIAAYAVDGKVAIVTENNQGWHTFWTSQTTVPATVVHVTREMEEIQRSAEAWAQSSIQSPEVRS